MRFGPVAVAEAAGAVLAHTVRLPGRVLKKGTVLAAGDTAALAAAGYREVIAARLDAGDLGEDEAASAVGRAVAGAGVRAAEPFTGRCNLFAAARGLVVIDRARIDALNAIDESLTIATVPPFAVVEADDMVATVKVIPFAARAQVIDACRAAAAGAPPIAVAPLVPRAAGLILTRLPGLPESLLDGPAGTMRTRLARLGSALAREVRCAHDEAEVATVLGELAAAGCSPVLVLGASATVDRADVIPAAVVRAGGAIEHLGMPVDPGNQLLLARLGETHVVGVPGCARSLKPSGFDWVLERLCADLPVGGADLAALGVGGLLVDNPGRPHPRRERAQPSGRRPAIAALVLAAGRSRRMAPDNKLLAAVDGAPMVARVVDALLAAPPRPIVVVLGHQADEVRAALAGRDVTFAVNPDHAQGMSTSLRAGLAALPAGVDGALVCLGDMPWVRPEHVAALCAAFDPVEGRAICVPYHAGKRGNPVLWAARYFAEMGALAGDTGARELLERHAEAVWPVAVDDPGVTIDVDTREALAALAPTSK